MKDVSLCTTAHMHLRVQSREKVEVDLYRCCVSSPGDRQGWAAGLGFLLTKSLGMSIACESAAESSIADRRVWPTLRTHIVTADDGPLDRVRSYRYNVNTCLG